MEDTCRRDQKTFGFCVTMIVMSFDLRILLRTLLEENVLYNTKILQSKVSDEIIILNWNLNYGGTNKNTNRFQVNEIKFLEVIAGCKKTDYKINENIKKN